MTAFYVFLLAVGGPLLLWFAFSGDGDADGGSGEGSGPLAVIPLSTFAFVMAFYGLAGLIFGAVGVHVVLTFVLATAAGLAAGIVNSAVFAWLRRNSNSSDVTDREIEGTIGVASMPIGRRRRGKITLEIAGAREQMTASPVDGSDIAAGDDVVVVRIERGVALVAPLHNELELE